MGAGKQSQEGRGRDGEGKEATYRRAGIAETVVAIEPKNERYTQHKDVPGKVEHKTGSQRVEVGWGEKRHKPRSRSLQVLMWASSAGPAHG